MLRKLRRFASLGCPVLAGLSRKSMLGAVTGRAVGDRTTASVVGAVLAAERGARRTDGRCDLGIAGNRPLGIDRTINGGDDLYNF